MGQPIEVERRIQGEVAVFTGDRSLTGQDGAGYHAGDGSTENGKLSATVAQKFLRLGMLFQLLNLLDLMIVGENFQLCLVCFSVFPKDVGWLLQIYHKLGLAEQELCLNQLPLQFGFQLPRNLIIQFFSNQSIKENYDNK
jgi:hypothetical protein